MAIYDQPFAHKGARNAQAAQNAIDQHRYSRLQRPAQPAAQPSQLARPSVASRAGSATARAASATKEVLTRPRNLGYGTVAKAGAKVAANVGGRLLSLPYHAAGAIGYYGGDALKDTAPAEALQRPLTNAMARLSGTDDLQARMLSDDPEVSRAAIAEYREGEANPSLLKRTVDSVTGYFANNDNGAQKQSPAPSDPTSQTNAERYVPRAGDESAVLAHTTTQGQPAGAAVNAGSPQAIEGTNYSYAGQYGDSQVIARPSTPTIPARNRDGSLAADPYAPVTEFTDDRTAFSRPGASQPAQSEEARAQQAREQYIANTTGSDGRRYFGGSATERLRSLQMAEARRGDPAGTVERQLDEEGLTPEQRAAYRADSVGAYQVDAHASSASAKAQMDAFKQQQDATRDRRQASRESAKEARLARESSLNEADQILLPYKESMPEVYSQLMAIAGEAYNPNHGPSMSQIVGSLLSSIKTKDGVPVLGEDGNVIFQEPPIPNDSGEVNWDDIL
ncbi:hypothetical protein [Parahaliea aestuarii]|uniref:Uncharacterized protein n=1 Tax=Parahaliea aestuarii TaxID=1852021 RepID=A0A5C9A6D7_9GAMM|nr:hypothetical protein [Parahaliea aestuarii]TXS95117.1 hypothetical protein FVW59_04260 [Parahaliea aestuarii]